MKTIISALTLLLLLTLLTPSTQAQRRTFTGNYGHALNLGIGIGGYSGYYGYYGHTLPVFDINYEFGVAKNFTLAPFLTVYSYSDDNYRALVTPVGVKGTLYLDQLLHAGSDWDFYTAGSLGVAIVNTTWDSNYNGDRSYYHSVDPLYLDLHLGARYHFNRNIGAFLDLSTGISTIGISIR